MIDTREAILSELATALGGVSGIASFWRNRGGGLPVGADLPAIVLFDGRERNDMDPSRLKSVVTPPVIVTLSVEIWIIPKKRDTVENATQGNVDAPIGPELSSWRMLVLDAVLNNVTLTGDQRTSYGILGPSGQIIYQGADTDLRGGQDMRGLMALAIDFKYLLTPPR